MASPVERPKGRDRDLVNACKRRMRDKRKKLGLCTWFGCHRPPARTKLIGTASLGTRAAIEHPDGTLRTMCWEHLCIVREGINRRRRRERAEAQGAQQ